MLSVRRTSSLRNKIESPTFYFMIKHPNFSPEIFSFGALKVRWYGLMYVLGYVFGYMIVKSRVKRGLLKITEQAAESLVTYLILGMLLGARIIFVFVYDFDRYSENLWEIFAIWQGGLSFHGAALGMIAASALFARKHGVTFYSVTDALAISAGPGLFFGRIGNFINGELYGRETSLPWGMIFPRDPDHVRHPSQIYQGLTEGLLLWGCLLVLQRWLLQTNRYRDGILGPVFLIGYGTLRFFTEFTREPDAQLGFVLGPLSMGQVLCSLMVFAGFIVFIHASKTQRTFQPQRVA